MKKTIIILAVCLISKIVIAQNELYNNGTTLQINTGCVVQVNGAFLNKTGSTLTNNGTLSVKGNITNDVAGVFNAGTLQFSGTTAQTLSGAADYNAKDVLINNAAGVTFNAKLKVDGTCTFTNGLVTAAATTTPLWFTANGTHTGASDASHVNGYVVKEGNGSFTYPVGDNTKYQKTDVNLSANATGMQVKYNAADAGAGSFTTTGSEAVALAAYNKLEHWDITPLSTATGTVTIYWDSYNNGGITNVGDLKVAHKSGGNWLNEGTIGSGTISAGSVTSNSISTWSPFTLGSISLASPLPLSLLSFSGSRQAGNNQLQWATSIEINTKQFELQKSTNGNVFTTIAAIPAKGTAGINNYSYSDVMTVTGTLYYRLKIQDRNGSYTYSSIVKMGNANAGILEVYPNPVRDIVSIAGARTGTNAVITDISGNILMQISITQNTFTIDMSRFSSGVYLLKTKDGAVQKIVKE